jgi:nucleotide-binding universal stress UspA family protein
MIEKIVVAVDDSPAALAAARLAIGLAAALGSRITAVAVHHEATSAVHDVSSSPVTDPTDGNLPVLRYVAARARRAGVPCESEVIVGEVVESVLSRADSLSAGLIVLGRSDRHRAGDPYVGSHTRRVLEFSDRPVLVVPAQPIRSGS